MSHSLQRRGFHNLGFPYGFNGINSPAQHQAPAAPPQPFSPPKNNQPQQHPHPNPAVHNTKPTPKPTPKPDPTPQPPSQPVPQPASQPAQPVPQPATEPAPQPVQSPPQPASPKPSAPSVPQTPQQPPDEGAPVQHQPGSTPVNVGSQDNSGNALSVTTITNTLSLQPSTIPTDEPVTITISGSTTVIRPGPTRTSTVTDGSDGNSSFPAQPSATGSTIATGIPVTSGSSSSHKISPGAIAGSVIGALMLLLLLIFLAIFIRRRQKRRLAPSSAFLDKSLFTQPSHNHTAVEPRGSYVFGPTSHHATASFRP